MANVVPYFFKQEVLKGNINLTAASPAAGSFWLALFTTAAPYTASSTVYSSADAGQVGTVGTAYATGGLSCGLGVIAQTGNFTTVDFPTNPNWAASTITARTGVLYQYVDGTTGANQRIMAILDFGANITSTAGDFTVTFPSPTSDAGTGAGSGAILSITGNP
jgi:hypothetical protein|tara:strand:- start:1005 stop:1493 length:489 start_codon:yes stop_codon:yes gene_type:complete